MSTTPDEHKADAPRQIRCAVITVSDTRTLETDSGGAEVIRFLTESGHLLVSREIVPDEPARMRPLLESYRDDDQIDAVLMTGGTGISSRDQTYETVSALMTKPLPGYGEMFRMLSYQEIGAAALLSLSLIHI